MPCPYSQPLYLFQLLFGASSSSVSCGLSPHPHSQPLLLYQHLFLESLALRVQLLAPTPILWDRFSILPPIPLLVLDYSLLFMLFSFVGGLSLVWGYGGLCARGG
jgi:hypothetical protein